MEKYYILDGKTAKSVDPITWATWFKKADRHVADERIGGCRISTIFLGFDHSFSPNEPPLLFETMVFDGLLNGEMDRYTTWEQAEKGHAAMVMRVVETGGKDERNRDGFNGDFVIINWDINRKQESN